MRVRGPKSSWRGEAGPANAPLSGAPLPVFHADRAPRMGAHRTREGRMEVTENGGRLS